MKKLNSIISFILIISIISSFTIIGYANNSFSNSSVIFEVSSKWNGLSLSSSFKNYELRYDPIDDDLPFVINMTFDKSSVKYNCYQEYGYDNVSSLSTSGSKNNEVIVTPAINEDLGELVLLDSYIPVINLKDLVYNTTIQLKPNEVNRRIIVWNDNSIIYNDIVTESSDQINLNMNTEYNFVVYNNSVIEFVGTLSAYVFEDNRVEYATKYNNVESATYVSKDISIDRDGFYTYKSDITGFHNIIVIPEASKIATSKISKISSDNWFDICPKYYSIYATEEESVSVYVGFDNNYVVTSNVSSPVQYSQSLATAGSTWNADNLNNIYYSTSTTLANSTILTTKPFYEPYDIYDDSRPACYMSSGCAITALAMVYRNRGGSISRNYDARGVSLSNKTVDPYTISLVNTSTTSVLDTTTINGKEYYIVSSSPVYANWATVSNYFSGQIYTASFPSTYTVSQKEAYIAQQIASNNGGIIVQFQSGSSNHYLVFTSYTYSNGTYSFQVCNPAGRSTIYSSFDEVWDGSYYHLLDNAVRILYVQD